MTAALEGDEWSAARPDRTLPPGKTRYPLYMRVGGPQGRSGRAENLAPPEFDPRTVLPVVSRYTDWATRPKAETCSCWYCLQYTLRCRINLWFYLTVNKTRTNRLKIICCCCRNFIFERDITVFMSSCWKILLFQKRFGPYLKVREQ